MFFYYYITLAFDKNTARKAQHNEVIWTKNEIVWYQIIDKSKKVEKQCRMYLWSYINIFEAKK